MFQGKNHIFKLVNHHWACYVIRIDFNIHVGLAEAGLISSKLSRSDMNTPEDVQDDHNLFYPER